MSHQVPPSAGEKQSPAINASSHFLDTLFRYLQHNVIPEDDEFRLVRQVMDMVNREAEPTEKLSSAPPGGETDTLWQTAIQNAGFDQLTPVISSIQCLFPHVEWISDPRYRQHDAYDTTRDRYACFEVVGPRGFFRHPRLTIGIFLMGPDCYYSSHTHRDTECILGLSGRGTWHLDNGPVISIPAGARVLIPYAAPHSFWTMEQPFLAVYMCISGPEGT